MRAEWLLFLAGLGAGIGFAARGALIFPGRPRRLAVGALVLASLATIATAWALEQGRRIASKRQEALSATVPIVGRPGGYLSSSACRACHPAEYASWHASYHRTMTQVASPESVRAPWDGVHLTGAPADLVLDRRADEFWVSRRSGAGLPDRLRVGLVTGSHHMQAYWTGGLADNAQEMLPYMYLIRDRRWVPARETFLADPKLPWSSERWNDHCLQCHVTAGQPRPGPGPDRRDSRVAEIGIGCESCHGPGAAHVAANLDPGRRYRRHLAAGSDPTIVNPRRLAPRAASQVCGQCHGVSAIADPPVFARDGFAYRPGDDLERTRPLLTPGHAPGADLLARAAAQEPGFVENRFWSDGMVRVSGREWNALERSRCHAPGGASCLSCHSMHRSDPVNQLAPAMDGPAACTGCHPAVGARIPEHTRHAAGSPGSDCYNCHMPYTAYGLLKGIRSHQIDSPDVAADMATGRPNACNLCHLDRSLGWTAEHLQRWYGTPAPDLPDEQRAVAAGAIWILRAEAGVRALAAWSMGWDHARRASGAAWMPAFLTLALSDSYSAVRYLAERALRRSPDFSTIEFDFAAQPADLEASVQPIVALWGSSRRPLPPDQAARLYLRPDGAPIAERLRALLARRDERSLDLQE